MYKWIIFSEITSNKSPVCKFSKKMNFSTCVFQGFDLK